MASGVYKNAIGAILKGNIDLENAVINCVLLTSDYTPDLDSDISLTDIPEDAIVSDATLTGKIINSDNEFKASDSTFLSVVAGKEVIAAVLYLDAETYGDSTLIVFFDNAPEFPLTTDGSDITVKYDPNGIGILKATRKP